MQRVVGIALGYEDLNDPDQIRHDPVLATAIQFSNCCTYRGRSLTD
jgi:hypothetical protein